MAILKVMTRYGPVEGLYSENPEITVFRGIPFAAPPTGDLRWAPPKPPKPWRDTYKAWAFRDIPFQVEERHPFYSREFYKCRKPMSEDCLFLNIWTGAKDSSDAQPVMVFIHGGGYKSGYSHEKTFDGDAIAKEGVILVTIEYRLGALGYLAHKGLRDTRGISGNYGLMDQIAALKWVRDNISAFGGDPENITVFGQSAGAMSVENLITSPLSSAYIAKAIMQSAGGYVSEDYCGIRMLSQQEAETVGEAFIRHLGCGSIEEARKLPAETVIEKDREFIDEIRPGFSFSPVVDGVIQPVSAYEAVSRFRYADIPYIVGTTANENGAFTYLPSPDKEEFVESVRKRFKEKADEFLELTGFYSDPENAMINGGWDDMLKPGIFAWADHAAERPERKPTYLYYFDRKMPGDNAGAYHSSELWYIFQTISRCWRELNGKDYDLSRAMVGYWTNFARTGDPNGPGLPVWQPYTKASRRSMELGENIGMSDFCGSPRTRFIVDLILNKR